MMLKLKGIIEKLKRKVAFNIKIFSLAPIVPDNKKGYDVYKNYLQQAFNDPTIKNIAITGNFGVGKSSFLKWFSSKKKYLFVSLCDFKTNEKCEINSLEFNLVQQLIIGCKAVCQNKTKIKISIFILTFVFNFLLAFILLSTNCMGCLDFISNLYTNVDFKFIIEKLQKYVYFLIAFVYFGVLPLCFSNIILRISLKKLSFKIAEIETELEVENKQNFSFIDFYRAELVSTLRDYSKKFDYTVVFEDMDRLNFDDCVTVFSELREINRLINLIPAKFNTAKKTVRFIYVIQDGVFYSAGNSSEDGNTERAGVVDDVHLKFFDYIIPFIPLFLDEAASNYFINCLNKIDYKCADEFVDIVGKYIYDYRVIENVINEYCVMRDIYEITEECKINNLAEKHIMALSVYKTLMPQDYQKIRINESVIQKSAKTEIQCIDQLILNGWLCLECLKYVGLSEMEIKNYIMKILTSNQWNDEKPRIVQNILKNKYCLCREVILKNNDKVSKEVYNYIVKNFGYSLFALEIKSSDKKNDLIRTLIDKVEDLKIEEIPTAEQINIWDNLLIDSSSDLIDDNIICLFYYLLKFSNCVSDFFSYLDDKVYLYILKCLIKLPLDCFVNYTRLVGFIPWINESAKNTYLFNQIMNALKNNDECIKVLCDFPDLDDYIKNSLQIPS